MGELPEEGGMLEERKKNDVFLSSDSIFLFFFFSFFDKLPFRRSHKRKRKDPPCSPILAEPPLGAP